MTNQTPVKEYRSGALSVAIWRNETQENGKTIVKHSVKPQKRYRDDKGNWVDSAYLFPTELLKMAVLLQKAYEFIEVKESKDEEESATV